MRHFLAFVVALASAVAIAEVIELEGTIKAIDAEARTVTIERKTPKGIKTLDLEVNKKAGDLSAVKVGDTISFGYDPALEVVTKIVEGVKQAEKVVAASGEDAARQFLDKMLTAIEANDYDGFVADTSAPFRATLTKEIVAKMNERLGQRMKEGYDLIFLT